MATFGSAGIKLDTRKLDALARGLKTNTSNALARTARQVEAKAKINIIAKDIIETGTLLGSITTTKQSDGVYWVHDGTEYGLYLELGHITALQPGSFNVRQFVAARPFLVPAVEETGEYIGGIVTKELF